MGRPLDGGEGAMILPNLDARIAQYKNELRPEDPQFGNGVSDWTITAEYRADLKVGGEDVWGCMCSPSKLPALECLTPEDVAAKRAHMIIRSTDIEGDLPEIERTIFHEFGHILVAEMGSPSRAAEENVMHSLDRFFGERLSRERAIALARAFSNPKARAYRATNGGEMPAPEDEKKPDAKAPPKQEPGDMGEEKKTEPKAQEGMPRTIAVIKQDLYTARVNGDTAAMQSLIDELLAAEIAESSSTKETLAETPTMPEAPTMGMKPEEAAAYRKKSEDAIKAAQSEAIEAIIDANPHLDDAKKAMVRAQGSAKSARALVATYDKPVESAKPRMGFETDPRKIGEKLPPMARAMKSAAENPMVRKVLGLGSMEDDGVMFEPGNGILLYIDGTKQLNHQRAKYEASRDKMRGAA